LQGISHVLKLENAPDAFFDLGGSSTEIIIEREDNRELFSFPVGAFILTEQYLKHDPPLEYEINQLKKYVDGILKNSLTSFLKKGKDIVLIGSGGTATSLAAMSMNLEEGDVAPERINGFRLDTVMIKSIYDSIRNLTFTERCRIKGIDEGRAEVILSGTIAVISIMEFFGSDSLTVSYSDILEGLILSYLKGEKR
jgi:exopolyphosphatase/guanosine-5'-triphosphate,3'-diphosphate pyrophosphatase